MSQIQFPSLSRRYFATTVDVLFLIAWVLLGVKTLTYFDVPTTSVIWYLVVLPVLLYEPVMTSKVVTLGQWLFKFRIR